MSATSLPPVQVSQGRMSILIDLSLLFSELAGPTSNLRATGRPVNLVIQADAKMPSPLNTEHSAERFRPAQRRITSQTDLQKFLKSMALKDFMGFILALNEAAQGQPLSAQTSASSAINSMVQVLDTLNSWVNEIPPAKQALRYGNPAYREWFAKVDDNADSLLRTILPPELPQAAIELKPILLDGFGNKTRIDYGTGHETTFCQLLFCLAKLGVFTERDRLALVSQVFAKYLRLMRKIQTTYWYAIPIWPNMHDVLHTMLCIVNCIVSCNQCLTRVTISIFVLTSSHAY